MNAKYDVVYYTSSCTSVVLTPEISRFPDGTVGVRIKDLSNDVPEHIHLRVQGYEPALIDILMGLKQIIENQYSPSIPISLAIPYMPHARYDRYMTGDDAHMLKIFAKQLNSLGLSAVFICDPHSTVTEALVDNVVVCSQHNLVERFVRRKRIDVESYDYIVAPDIGAVKKAQKIADQYKLPLVVLNKVRDLETGNITGLEILGKLVFAETDTFLIVDDLCDGGRTFVEVAKTLKAFGGGDVDLYVTHGIFSQGVENLVDNGIRHVYSTNSFKDIEHESLTQLDVMNIT